MNRLLLCLGAVLLTAMGCRWPTPGPNPNPNPGGGERIVISNGTSHGMCVGYCKTDMTIEGTSVKVVMKPWGRGAGGGLPDSVLTGTISTQEWNDLVAATAGMSAFGKGDSVIGCPDCADQGAEYVDVMRGTASQRVTFDDGASVAPIQSLLDKLRAIRQRIRG